MQGPAIKGSIRRADQDDSLIQICLKGYGDESINKSGAAMVFI